VGSNSSQGAWWRQGTRVESAELGRRGEVEAEGTGRNCPGIWLAAAGTREIAREVEIGERSRWPNLAS
jgi:hypothetical protein